MLFVSRDGSTLGAPGLTAVTSLIPDLVLVAIPVLWRGRQIGRARVATTVVSHTRVLLPEASPSEFDFPVPNPVRASAQLWPRGAVCGCCFFGHWSAVKKQHNADQSRTPRQKQPRKRRADATPRGRVIGYRFEVEIILH